MQREPLYPRYAEVPLAEALADSPAVLIHGPRQCGKTTLARWVGSSRGHEYVSFDDDVARAAAAADPAGFVAGLPERATLDEVQRVPTLFTALKQEIDAHRTPGRFLLTGSSQVLLVPALSDSLAGRMEILRLHPLSQGEIGRGVPNFLDDLFRGSFQTATTLRLGDDLADRMAAGGYPAALARPTARRRANWYRNFIDTQLQRDVRDMARISALDVLPRLLRAAASQTARLYNLSDLSSPFQLSRPTIGDYVELLERLFLVDRLPPWHGNRLSRLVKTPKLHIGDTGLGCALIGANPGSLARDRSLFGQFLETFVFQELRRQAVCQELPLEFYHYRDKDQVEVDIVIERGSNGGGRRRGEGRCDGNPVRFSGPSQVDEGNRRPVRRRGGALRWRDCRRFRRPDVRRASSLPVRRPERWAGFLRPGCRPAGADRQRAHPRSVVSWGHYHG